MGETPAGKMMPRAHDARCLACVLLMQGSREWEEAFGRLLRVLFSCASAFHRVQYELRRGSTAIERCNNLEGYSRRGLFV